MSEDTKKVPVERGTETQMKRPLPRRMLQKIKDKAEG